MCYNAPGMIELCKRPGLPACVVGSVSDWDTWQKACEPGAEPPCDVVELRADALPETIRPCDILACRCARPVLLTIRHASEGGCRVMPEPQRVALAMELLPLARYLDWETERLECAGNLVGAAHAAGVAVIASNHDFAKTPSPERMLSLAKKAVGLGADLAKFAFRLCRAEDLLAGVALLERAECPVAAMGMGPLGPVSRLLYAQYGSELVYGYLGGKPTAPGQWGAALCSAALAGLGRAHS